MTWHSQVATGLARQGLGMRRQCPRRTHDKVYEHSDSALGRGAYAIRTSARQRRSSAHDRGALSPTTEPGTCDWASAL